MHRNAPTLLKLEELKRELERRVAATVSLTAFAMRLYRSLCCLYRGRGAFVFDFAPRARAVRVFVLVSNLANQHGRSLPRSV
eukprot:3939309-Rhodomonas_salina.1